MRPLLAASLLAPRLRRRFRPDASSLPPYEQIFGPHVPGRSFVDVGTMWNVNGRYAFAAEAAGAGAVTAFDGMAPTPEFEAEHARRSSRVKYVGGDINEASSVSDIGVHDVVWCAGVIYHSPEPVRAVKHLCQITGDRLILGSKTIPELPGVPQGCVFFPGLNESERRPYARVFDRAMAINSDFDPGNWYGNWWWGITPSAMRAMIEINEGIEVVDELRAPFDTILVARRSSPPTS